LRQLISGDYLVFDIETVSFPKTRLVIAFHSPNVFPKTGLRMCGPEKSRDSDALHWRVVRSLQSGLSRKNREMWACFAYFRVRGGGLSLQ